MSNVKELSNEELLKYITGLVNKANSEEKNLESLELDMKNRMPDVVASGVQDMNKVIWPAQFSSGYLLTSPSKQTNEKNMVISQEAAFVCTKMVKSVFKYNGPGDITWINPEDISTLVNDVYVLSKDPQSTRSFNKEPISVQNIGYAKFPTKLLSRPLILPNSAINIQLNSKNNVDTYYTNITFFGYRIRIEDAQDILGLVTRY